MQAISGKLPDFIRELQSVTIGEEGFGDALDWGSARGRDFQCVATIVYIIREAAAAYPGAPQLEKWLLKDEAVSEKTKNGILEAFRIFVHLARQKKYSSCFQKPTRVSPVEFIMIGVLIYRLKNELSFAQLSSIITKMREDVRTKHVDIRANKKVMATMFKFLKKVKLTMFKDDDKGTPSAAAAIVALHKTSKRKRADAELEDNDEEPQRRVAAKRANGKVADPPKAKTKTTTSSSRVASGSKGAGENGTKTAVRRTATRGSASTIPAQSSRPGGGEPSSSNTSRPEQQSARAPPPTVSRSSPRPSPSHMSPRPPSVSAPPSAACESTQGAPLSEPRPPSRGPTNTAHRADSVERTLPSISRRTVLDSVSGQAPPSVPPDVSTSYGMSSDQRLVTVKPDPDTPPSLTSFRDRLAPIRNAKTSERGPNSPVQPSPTQSSFLAAQLQRQQSPLATSAPAPPALLSRLQAESSSSHTVPFASSTERSVHHPRLSVDSAFQNSISPNQVQNSHATPNSQKIMTQLQSILAKAGYSPPQERRSSVDATPAVAATPISGEPLSNVTRDPRKRSSATPTASPNQPLSPLPSVASMATLQASSTPPTAPVPLPPAAASAASPPSVIQPSHSPPASAGAPSTPAAMSTGKPLSPTLPRKPDALPKIDKPSSDILAVPMMTCQRPRDIGKRSRWDQQDKHRR